jgi:hypothetical protein
MAGFRGKRTGGQVIAFWLRDGRFTAGMDVTVWDMNGRVQAQGRPRQADEVAALAGPRHRHPAWRWW